MNIDINEFLDFDALYSAFKDYILKWESPDDIFSTNQLKNWAKDNNYVRLGSHDFVIVARDYCDEHSDF